MNHMNFPVIIGLLSSLLLISCEKAKEEEIENKDDVKVSESQKKPPPILIKKSSLLTQLVWNGTTNYLERIEIRTNNKIKILKTLVRKDDQVKKGQLLLSIDKSEEMKTLKDLEGAYILQELQHKGTLTKVKPKREELNRKKNTA